MTYSSTIMCKYLKCFFIISTVVMKRFYLNLTFCFPETWIPLPKPYPFNLSVKNRCVRKILQIQSNVLSY